MAKKAKKVQAPEAARDDALFETLGKNKKRRRRRILFTVISIVLILGIIAVAGVSFLQRRVREQFGSNQGEVLSYEVTTGSMVTITMNAKGEVTYVLISSQSYLGSSGRN